MALKDNDLGLILRSDGYNELDLILLGRTTDEQNIVLQGIGHPGNEFSLIMVGITGVEDELPLILTGKRYNEMAILAGSKSSDECGLLLNAVDPTKGYQFTDITDFSLTSGAIINEITINYAYDQVDGKPTAAITKHNPLSKLLYGTARQTLDLKMIQGSRQAEKIADAILFTSSIPESIASFTHDMRSIHIEVGDDVTISHPAGLGANGYQEASAFVSKKRLKGITINYEVIMKAVGDLYLPELLSLSQVAGTGESGINIQYENGVATITIYAKVQGSPPVEGAEVTISSIRKITDKKGQVRFNLLPGRYTAYIEASGYEDADITFSV